jgi:hypothetical protein
MGGLAFFSPLSMYLRNHISPGKVVSFSFWFVFLFIVVVYNKQINNIRIEFEIAIHSLEGEVKQGEFYFDTGQGISERHSVKFQYYQHSDGTYARYSIVLPADRISLLRFDPVPSQGVISIRNIIVHKYYPLKIKVSDIRHSLVPLNSVEKIEIRGNEIIITANGDDPHILLFKNLPEFTLATFVEHILNQEIDKIISGLLALSLISGLLTHFSISKDDKHG